MCQVYINMVNGFKKMFSIIFNSSKSIIKSKLFYIIIGGAWAALWIVYQVRGQLHGAAQIKTVEIMVSLSEKYTSYLDETSCIKWCSWSIKSSKSSKPSDDVSHKAYEKMLITKSINASALFTIIDSLWAFPSVSCNGNEFSCAIRGCLGFDSNLANVLDQAGIDWFVGPIAAKLEADHLPFLQLMWCHDSPSDWEGVARFAAEHRRKQRGGPAGEQIFGDQLFPSDAPRQCAYSGMDLNIDRGRALAEFSRWLGQGPPDFNPEPDSVCRKNCNAVARDLGVSLPAAQ